MHTNVQYSQNFHTKIQNLYPGIQKFPDLQAVISTSALLTRVTLRLRCHYEEMRKHRRGNPFSYYGFSRVLTHPQNDTQNVTYYSVGATFGRPPITHSVAYYTVGNGLDRSENGPSRTPAPTTHNTMYPAKSPPCVKGGDFCDAKIGGIVNFAVTANSEKRNSVGFF